LEEFTLFENQEQINKNNEEGGGMHIFKVINLLEVEIENLIKFFFFPPKVCI
jgi:hypothetical protein